MAEKHDAVVLSHLDAAVEVEVGHQHRVGIQVEKHFFAFVFYGFLEIHIDLSRNGFVTVSNRGSSFGDLNTVHPRSWDVIQAESRGQAAEIGDDFGHHLGVDSAQA